MTNTRTALVSLVLGLVALTGCKKSDAPGQPGAATSGGAASGVAAPGAAPESDSQQEADGQLGEKLSKYIDCFNSFSSSVHRSEDRYFEWVDEKKGVTGKESSVMGLYQIDPSGCIEKIDKAKPLPPSLPDVEAAAEAYKAAATELTPLVAAAYTYYDQDDFKDDKFAKAKEMHGPLFEAFKKFDAADKALDGKVVALNEALSDRRLKVLANDPNRKIQYLVEKSVSDAKKLLAAAKVQKLEDLDEAKYTAALTSYETDVNNLDAFTTANKAEADKIMMFSSLMSNERDLLKAAKELGRRKRDNRDFNKEASSNFNASSVDGHPAQVIDKFNSLIGTVNGITYRN
jgi:hypothetical protein